jgi:hypothetical protein
LSQKAAPGEPPIFMLIKTPVDYFSFIEEGKMMENSIMENVVSDKLQKY